jgi:cystathionine beta-lyase/cystathionine gamma-synthase
MTMPPTTPAATVALRPSWRAGTSCVRAGTRPDPTTGALVPPLVQSTTYAWSDLDHPPAISYARAGNPTVEALERRLAALEGGTSAVAFASGTAALDALLAAQPKGGRIVCGSNVYGGTVRLLERIRTDRCRVDFVDTSDLAQVRAALEQPADLVIAETPSNPTLAITDLAATAKAAHDAGALLCVDNTFLTPLWQKPLAHGADVVLHSTTKYLDGHNATLGGALVVPERHDGPGFQENGPLGAKVRWVRKGIGNGLAPFEAWLTLQGCKTLHLRTREQWISARRLAERLRRSPVVRKVLHPGLEEHPGHAVHRRQATGDGGIVSLDLGSREAARAFCSNLRLFTLAENLGATESLATHPVSMTHTDVDPDVRRRLGITDGLVRLSVGVEDADDLQEDALRALEAVAAGTLVQVRA